MSSVARIGRLRAAARFLARCPLERRLEACRRLGVDRDCDVDPVGQVLSGGRTALGLQVVRVTVPLGVVGLIEPEDAQIADCLLAGCAVAAEHRDVHDVRSVLAACGLNRDVVMEVDYLETHDVDAVLYPSGLSVADRSGTHRHVYVDATAPLGVATYVIVNAAAYGVVDTIVFHADYPDSGVADTVTSLENLGADLTLVRVRNMSEAVDVIDRRSSGQVETILTNDICVLRDFRDSVDSAVLVANASPALLPEDAALREVIGLTRTRTLVEGNGQTLPVDR